MTLSKWVCIVAVLALWNASSLLAICNNCEPNPSSPTYVTTAQARPLLPNERGSGRATGKAAPTQIVKDDPGTALFLGSTSYTKAIPILHLAGRNGLDVDLTLTYNSRVWTKDVKNTNKFTFNADRDWPAPGFRLGFGFLEFNPGISGNYTVTEASGAKHLIDCSTTCDSTDNTYMHYDPTQKILSYKNGLQVTYGDVFSLYDPVKKVWTPSTTLLRPTQIKDTNGNFITISYIANSEQSVNTITDTLGRVISFGYDTTGNLNSITWNGQFWVLTWNSAYVLNYNFTNGVLDSPATGAAIPVLTGIGFPPPPGFTGGSAYLFTYGDWGIVNQIGKYSAGGNLRNSVAYNYQNASSPSADFPTYTTLTRFDGVLTSATTYQVTGTSSNPTSVTITDPSTSSTSKSPTRQTITTLDTKGLTKTIQVVDAAAPSTVLRQIAYTWTSDTGGINSRPSQITSTLENGQSSSVVFTYTTNGNIQTRTENDYSGSQIRTTAFQYVTTAPLSTLHILDRVSQVLVKDAAGNLVAETDLAYDAYSTSLVSVTGAAGHDDANFGSAYTSRGNLSSTTAYKNAAAHSGGIVHNLNYDTLGNLRTADADCCKQKSWSFSSATQYAFPDSVTDGVSPGQTLKTSMTYYPNTFLPNTVTDPNRQSITYAYDTVNRLSQVTRNADSKNFYTAYDDSSATPTTASSSDLNSAIQKTQTDGVGKPLRSDLYNATTLISSTKTYFDELGRAYMSSNPFGPSETELDTVAAFDALGRTISKAPSSGGSSTFSYAGNTMTVTDPAGKARRSYIDAAGRLVRVDEPGWGDAAAGQSSVLVQGQETFGFLCANQQCPKAWDSGTVSITVNGLTKTVSYGQNTNTTANAVATSLAALINGDAAYPVTAFVGGVNVSMTAKTTGLSTNYTLSASTTCTCAASGPSYTVTASGSTLTGGLDLLSGPSVANLTHPLFTTYTYDAINDLLTVAQGAMGPVNGQFLAPQNRAYVYDSLARLTSSQTPEANQVATTFTYYDFGGVNTRTDPRGIITTNTYDTLNRLSTVGYSDSTPGVTYTYGSSPTLFNNGLATGYTDGTGSTTYTYNKLGQVTNAAKLIGATTYNIQYAYNLAGELQTLTYPSGRVVTQNYDPIGRLKTISDASNNYMTINPTTDYNSAGQLKHFAYGNGVVADFGYNDHLQTKSIRYSKTGSADLLNLTYGYGTQNDGEIASITDSLDSTKSESFTYDPWAHLSTAQAGSNATPTWKYSYDYDRFGNRLNQNLLAGSQGYNTLLTIDPTTNRITTTGATYDNAGNMTGDGSHTYTFDAANRITAVDGTAATYSYDGPNLRVKKTTGSTATVYVFSGSSLIAEYTGSAPVTSPSKEYISENGKVLATVASGAITYYHPDRLSTRVESNGSGVVSRTYGHLPFGEKWYETGTVDKWKFTTYENDSESGLNYAMNRFDSSQFGRFMSTDPVAGSMHSPQSLNRYAHVGDDPVNRTDPFGLLMIPACEWDRSCGGGEESGWSPPGDQGAGIQACGVDGYCIGNGGIGPFGSPLAQIHCDSSGCMTGSWQYSQYNVGGTISVDWGAQKAGDVTYVFTGGDGSILEQQKELAAIKLGEKYCEGQGSSGIAACIQQAYDTLQVAPVGPNKDGLIGGNYNFDSTQVVIGGADLGANGCLGGRCGVFDSLHFHSDGTFHVDTANPFFVPIGSFVHLVFDYIGGHEWWSEGIPRPVW